MWTNLTTWWNRTPLTDWPENRLRSCFCILRTLPFSAFLSFPPLVRNYHTDCADWHGEGPNMRGRSLPWLQTTRQRRQDPSISHLKGHDTHNKHRPLKCNKIWCCVCSTKNSSNIIQVTSVQHQVVSYPLFRVISHQTACMRTSWH